MDPNQLPDANGLSVDSMRGTEFYIVPRFVGGTEKNPNDGRILVREPLSYHEARSLDLIGQTVDDDKLHPDVLTIRTSIAPTVVPDEYPTAPGSSRVGDDYRNPNYGFEPVAATPNPRTGYPESIHVTDTPTPFGSDPREPSDAEMDAYAESRGYVKPTTPEPYTGE